MTVDSLQVATVVIVIFVIVLATEIIFACCRLYNWLKRKVDGTEVPTGRYRRGSVSHSWSEASVVQHQNTSGVDDSHGIPNGAIENGNTKSGSIPVEEEYILPFKSRGDLLGQVAAKIDQNHADLILRRRRSSTSLPPSDRLLLSSDFIKCPEQDWISGQFVCNSCKSSLTGQRYILHDDKSYCKKCYELLFANICDKCKIPITCDYKDLSCKDRHWHDTCFRCSGCSKSLVEQPFAYKDQQLYCASCYDNRFAARCTLCGNIFRTGMKKYEHKGRQWHAECFCCKICEKLIGTNSFIPKGQDILCVSCYERQLGQNCRKCQQVITRSGIIYKNSAYHRECFQCSHCQKSLNQEKYTSVNCQPYCVQCYSDLFAKKCHTCRQAITGIDDPKFISFDGRQWHANCFKCSKCDTGLVGKGFMTENSQIFCPDCCRET